MPYKSRLIIALDVGTEDNAIDIVDKFGDYVEIYKIGFELFSVAGLSVIERLNSRGKKVFLDLKFHDIPNTVSRAASLVTKMGVYMFNLHASGGLEMMRRCKESAYESAYKHSVPMPKIVAVTVLTSLTSQMLKDELSIAHGVKTHVKTLASLAQKAGLDGVVASSHETSLIKKTFGRNFLVVAPGIRPSWMPPDDQKRTATPKEAIKEGTDYIVMGRGVLSHPDPLKAIELVALEILTV